MLSPFIFFCADERSRGLYLFTVETSGLCRGRKRTRTDIQLEVTINTAHLALSTFAFAYLYYWKVFKCENVVFNHGWIIGNASFPNIIKIIIWFGDIVTMSHLTKCNTNSKVWAMTAWPTILFNTLSCRGFPPNTASSTFLKAQTWPQFNLHALETKDEYTGSAPIVKNEVGSTKYLARVQSSVLLISMS